MKTVSLIGFREVGFDKNSPYANEDALIRAGHVGVMLEGDDAIYGFHPTPEAIEAEGGIENVINKLKDKRAAYTIDGRVYNDRNVFVRAAELAELNTPIRFASNTKDPVEFLEVWQFDFSVDDEEFLRIRDQLLAYFEKGTISPYAFPRFNPTGDNCATFPMKIGIRVPVVEPPGQLSLYIPELEKQGKRWRPPQDMN